MAAATMSVPKTASFTSARSRPAARSSAPQCTFFPGRFVVRPRVSSRVVPRANSWHQCNPNFSYGARFGGNVNPWAQILRDLEKPFEASMKGAMQEMAAAASLPVDAEEMADAYTFTADVPGLAKADLKIRVNQDERMLTIAGERRRSGTDTASPSGNEAGEAAAASSAASPFQGKARRERRFGKFERRFRIPEDADLDAVSARVEKGVLTLTIRKSEAAQRRERDISID